MTGYIVQRKVFDDEGWLTEELLDADKDLAVITTNIKKVPMNTECKLRVTAKNKDVNGHYSEESVITPEIYPGIPTHLRGDKVQPYRVKLRWQYPQKNPEAVYEYKIEVFEKNVEVKGDAICTKGLSKVITGLEPLTRYTVRVTALNVNGKSCRDDEKRRPEEKFYTETVVKTVLSDRWRMFVNGISAGQAARRPDPDSDLLSSGEEN